MPVSGKELIRELRKAGYEVKRITGSHYVMDNGKISVVSNHSSDLPKETEMAIRKRTGVYR